jgi:hypothetical protein
MMSAPVAVVDPPMVRTAGDGNWLPLFDICERHGLQYTRHNVLSHFSLPVCRRFGSESRNDKSERCSYAECEHSEAVEDSAESTHANAGLRDNRIGRARQRSSAPDRQASNNQRSCGGPEDKRFMLAQPDQLRKHTNQPGQSRTGADCNHDGWQYATN